MKESNNKKNSDKKKTTAIKLLVYTLFVIVVSIFAISNSNNVQTKEQEENQTSQEEIDLNEIIEIPNEYNYKISITINEENYEYTGTKKYNKETIIKEIDGIINNYIYEDGNYYKELDEEYILISKEEIYDIIDYNYLDLKTINTYLSKSIKDGNNYLIYLKDIILGNDSEEYIIINSINNKIDIDYTSLMKKFDKTIEKYYVKIEIEEIE